MSGYLGIDESNHSRVPSIFVGCYHSGYENGDFYKLRRGQEYHQFAQKNLSTDFKHIVFDNIFCNQFDGNQLMIISACELIKHYKPTDVFLDGEFPDENNFVQNILTGINGLQTNIQIIVKGDETNNLLHRADTLANYLYRNYTHRSPKLYLDKLVSPKVESYEYLLQ